MLRLALALLFTFSLFLPTTAFLSSSAPLSVKSASASVIVEKVLESAVVTSVVNAAALVNPATWVSVGVGVGASVAYIVIPYSLQFSKNKIIGSSFNFSDSDPDFKKTISAEATITQVKIYTSPVQNFTVFQHHEIVFQIGGLFWGLISFGHDGLQTAVRFDELQIVKRRKNNTILEGYQKKINASTKKVRDFLKQYQGQHYNLLIWNCQQFSKALWDALVK